MCKSHGQPGTCCTLPPHGSWYQGAALAAKHLLTSADMCQELSVCGKEPSLGFATRDPSGVLVLVSLLVLEQGDAVHIEGAVSAPDMWPRDRFLLWGHPTEAAAICSGRTGPGEEGAAPLARPALPRGEVSCSTACPKPLSVLMLCACWPG